MYTMQFRQLRQLVYLRTMLVQVQHKLHRKMLLIEQRINIGNMRKLRKHSIVLLVHLFANILKYRAMLS